MSSPYRAETHPEKEPDRPWPEVKGFWDWTAMSTLGLFLSAFLFIFSAIRLAAAHSQGTSPWLAVAGTFAGLVLMLICGNCPRI